MYVVAKFSLINSLLCVVESSSFLLNKQADCLEKNIRLSVDTLVLMRYLRFLLKKSS